MANFLFNTRLNNLDNELNALENQKQRELEIAGNNEAAKVEIQDPKGFYESRLMSLVDFPKVSGPLKIDKAKYMATLEKPDTDALMDARDAITNDHIARSSYSGTLLKEGKVIANPVLRDRAVEVYSLYAETSAQVEHWEKHQELCEAFNEYNGFLAESGLARSGDIHKLWDIPSIFTWVPGDSNYVPNYEHFNEIKRRSLMRKTERA